VLEPLAAEQAVTVGLDVAAGLPPVSCDRHRLMQVLANLLGNAVKVMPGGGAIRLSVRAASGQVLFTVADTGPGIAAEDAAQIFERYWRGQNPGYEGTGLGLAIARGVVEAHGGRIWVESAPGEGAAFTFSLPAEPPPVG
jgi:signal transduction histidine kinase